MNHLIPLINNTPIRGLLDKIDPAGASAVRLLGAPVSTTMSPDGTRLYVVTDPVTSTLPLLSFFLPSASSVTEIDTRTNKVVGVPIAFGGSPLGPVVVSPDGTRAYLTTSSGGGNTRVTIIDTGNSTSVRGVTGTFQGVVGTADGIRVFLGTMDSAANVWTGVMVDGTTGAQIGQPLQIAGSPSARLTFSPDGSHAYETTILAVGNERSTVVTVINTADNTLLGTTVLDDSIAIGGVVVSPDGQHVVQVTDPTLGPGTAVTMLDPLTGAVVGTPVELDGGPSTYPAVIYLDGGHRLAVATYTGSQSLVTILNAADGTVVGTPVVVQGNRVAVTGQVAAFGEGDDRLYLLSQYWDVDEGSKTLATVVDTTDSTVVGTPLLLDGEPPPTNSLIVSPDGSRVFQTLRPSSTSQSQSHISSVAMVGTDGTLLAAPAPVKGTIFQPGVFSPDGSRAYQLSETSTTQSWVTAIDATTGAVIGSPVAVKGLLGDELFVAADGASAYVTTRVTSFSLLLLPFPIPIELSLNITHVNAIDTSRF